MPASLRDTGFIVIVEVPPISVYSVSVPFSIMLPLWYQTTLVLTANRLMKCITNDSGLLVVRGRGSGGSG